MNIREPYRYTDPVLGARTIVHTDDRGFVQITIAHATDPARVMATRIRDDALDGLIEELTAARAAIQQSTWPAHLRDDAPRQQCSRCKRYTCDTSQFGAACWMTQPDGLPCGGRFGP